MATTRERLRELLDAVPDARLSDVEAAIQPFTDPVIVAFLSAPEDDEPTTGEDLEALAEARAEYERGETVPLEVALAELDGHD
jgi:hypothetical protein